MNYRKHKKKIRKDTLKEIYKLNTTNDDVVVVKFSYGKVTHKELYNYFEFIKRYIKHKQIIALPDIMSLEELTEEEIRKWIALANTAIK